MGICSRKISILPISINLSSTAFRSQDETGQRSLSANCCTLSATSIGNDRATRLVLFGSTGFRSLYSYGSVQVHHLDTERCIMQLIEPAHTGLHRIAPDNATDNRPSDSVRYVRQQQRARRHCVVCLASLFRRPIVSLNP